METQTITVHITAEQLRERVATTGRVRGAVGRALSPSPHDVLDVVVDSFAGHVTFTLASDDIANASTIVHEVVRDIADAHIPTRLINI